MLKPVTWQWRGIFFKKHTLTQQVRDGAWDSAFLTSFQVTLLLLIEVPPHIWVARVCVVEEVLFLPTNLLRDKQSRILSIRFFHTWVRVVHYPREYRTQHTHTHTRAHRVASVFWPCSTLTLAGSHPAPALWSASCFHVVQVPGQRTHGVGMGGAGLKG